ncbi:MAG: 6-carboxytetrahydropterin synthase, partial [Phycisphaeraceae bacterium]
MVELSRTVRFCLDDRGPAEAGLATARHNTFAAWPAMRGLGRYYALTVTCRGEVDPVTGYFLNIKFIDEAVREHVLPHLAALIAEGHAGDIAMGTLMQRLVALLQPPLNDSVTELVFHLTPHYALEIRSDAMNHVIVRQQYAFSAAHRLHVPELSDAENRRIFGKCNNPAGHGHNYRLEIAVRSPVADTGQALDVADLDALVDRAVIQKLDHKHLNRDVPQFEGRNPSVEHIAQVIWHMLADELRAMGEQLEEVRVWETDKTVCTYRG